MKSLVSLVTESYGQRYVNVVDKSELEALVPKLEAIIKKVLPKFDYHVLLKQTALGYDMERNETHKITIYIEPDKKAKDGHTIPNGICYTIDQTSFVGEPDVLHGGQYNGVVVKIKPLNSYLAMSSVKIPFRKSKPTEALQLKCFETYLKRYKQILIDNYDNLYYSDEKFPEQNLAKKLGI